MMIRVGWKIKIETHKQSMDCIELSRQNEIFIN